MATLDPILSAPFAIQFHVVSALLALVLGPYVLLRKRRDRLHKITGYIWVVAMVSTALSSFFITEVRVVGPFSPIHLLSIFTLFGVFQAMRFALTRQILAHKKNMQSLFVWGLLLAGTLSFMPGRIMNVMVFGEAELAGFLVVLGISSVFWFVYVGGLRLFGRGRGHMAG